MDNDEQQIQLLSIFHYIVGGLTAFFACFPFLHVAVGIAMLSGALDGDGSSEAPPAIFAWMFILLPGLFILIGWSVATCMIIAGYKLAHYRCRTFCTVVAGLECMLMPFGTVLGVLTIVVLMRESVIKRFDPPTPPPVPPQGG
jgi:hypothetical protein